jgi:hypothetical protein
MGFTVGAMAGAGLGDNGEPFGGMAEALLLGSLVGGMSMPAGVHGANHQRGSYGLTTLASFSSAAAAWATVIHTGKHEFVYTIPFIQVAACVVAESLATRPRVRDDSTDPVGEETFPLSRPQLGFMPQEDGLGLMITGSF